MVTISPQERAVFRAAYMSSLAVALVDGNAPHWWSASDAERAEVRSSLGAHVVLPTEQELILRECQRVDAEAKAAVNLLLVAARRDKAAVKKQKLAETKP